MKIKLIPKTTKSLLPTDILFQTPFWSRVKSCLGFKPVAFDVKSPSSKGDILVLIQPHGAGGRAAYIPQGPECGPDNQEEYGLYLEKLSQAMFQHLGSDISFIRYDLPWKSQYAEEIRQQKRLDYPRAELREMRMNMGTSQWNLRKASMDMTVSSSLIVDINIPEKKILNNMKSKTRYNIGLAERKGVRVIQAGPERLHEFYDLYVQTAQRNNFSICEYRHFTALFNTNLRSQDDSRLLFLLATHNQDILAGAIIGISNKNALYLYGASSNTKRNFMAPYAMHWEAMLQSKAGGCHTYDMGAISPSLNRDHPFYGLYRFKTGFGGRIEYRSGSWDYPFVPQKYHALVNSNNLARAVGA